MANPLLLPLLNWARGLRYPTLFKLAAAAFAVSVLLPDPVPFIDEIVLRLCGLAKHVTRFHQKKPARSKRGIKIPQ